MAPSLIRKYDFDVATTNKVERLHCFFVFGWMKLKFGVRGNFRHLISNLNPTRGLIGLTRIANLKIKKACDSGNQVVL